MSLSKADSWVARRRTIGWPAIIPGSSAQGDSSSENTRLQRADRRRTMALMSPRATRTSATFSRTGTSREKDDPPGPVSARGARATPGESRRERSSGARVRPGELAAGSARCRIARSMANLRSQLNTLAADFANQIMAALQGASLHELVSSGGEGRRRQRSPRPGCCRW